MGTVHAKAADNEVGGGLFEFDEPIELDEEPIPKPTIKLDGVRARVDRVHVDGLNRTKDDIIKSTVDELFHATDFEDVILKAHKVRRALDSMGCFRDIGVFIDVSSGPGATPEGLEVTFQVKELSRIVGGVNTTVSENEGNLVLGVKMPNVLGRGEKIQAEYSMGYRSSSNFSVAATKPYPHKPLVPVVSATVYQQNHEYPWSGYRLLDRGLLMDLAFKSSTATKHNIQWEGMVRDTSVLSKTTSFKVRESSGPQMKSVIRHIVAVDHRDEGVFPTRGTWVQFASELAGLGGGVANLKTELHAQANVPVADSLVLQMTGALGVLHDVFGTEIPDHFFLGGPTTLRGFRQRGVGPHCDGQATGGKIGDVCVDLEGLCVCLHDVFGTEIPDHFFLGGPTTLRGFRQRGVGPHCDGQATGGKTYWAAGVHVFGPLPFTSSRNGIAALFRSHAFLNMGCLAQPEDSSLSTLEALSAVRVSCGAGVALRIGRAARLELNYCVPLKAAQGDVAAPGLQFGVGATFL